MTIQDTSHTSVPVPVSMPSPDGPPIAHDGDAALGLSRRALIGGLGAAGAFGLAGGFGAMPAAAAGDVADAIESPTEGLVYLTLDAFAFDVASTDSNDYRLYQQATGMQPQGTTKFIYAALPVPVGSVVKKINVSYQGQPIVSIAQRPFASGDLLDLTPVTTLAAGGGAKSQTLTVTGSITGGASYSMKVFCSPGDSILGMEVGYIPPAQAFVPFAGADPRAFDSRLTTAFAANEERVIDLSTRLIPTARAAVINLTATQTGGPGFLAAFADGITYPGNSSVNFSAANATIANGAVVAMTAGKIKVRTGPAASHVIVDVIGSLL